jgi:isoleucyl-tRNA synthetase
MNNQLNQEMLSFADNEREILEFWKRITLYDKIQKKNRDKPIMEKIDGPPFPSSDSLHFGHVHIGIMKSIFDNYWSMNQYRVTNKIGYDCHGLPIEQVVSKMLNLTTNQEIRHFGVGEYNQKCEETIKKFSGAWQPIYQRIARFVDFNNEYKTLDLPFMESVWWVWKSLWDKNLVYRGYRIMPYSTACGTALSSSEASGDDIYKET